MQDVSIRTNKALEAAKAKIAASMYGGNFDKIEQDIRDGFDENPFTYEQFSDLSGFLYGFDDVDCKALWNYLDLPAAVPQA